jgi:hypothetical protein
MANVKDRKAAPRRRAQDTPETLFVTTVDATSALPGQGMTNVIPAAQLAESFHATIAVLETMFAEASQRTIGTLAIDEIAVGLAVSADGHVSLLGSGSGITGSATIQLKFRRRR